MSGANPAPTAAERKADDGRDRVGPDPLVRAEVGGQELLAVIHHPPGDLLERQTRLGVELPACDNRQLSRGSAATTAQPGAGIQVAARSTMNSPTFSGRARR